MNLSKTSSLAILGVCAMFTSAVLLSRSASAQSTPPAAGPAGGFPGVQRNNFVTNPPVSHMVVDGNQLFVVRGETIYRINKGDMKIDGQVSLPAIRPRQNLGLGGSGN